MKNSTKNFSKFLYNRYNRVNKRLDKYLKINNKSKNLSKAMRYAVLNGGKRIRPLLVYAVGEIYGADIRALDAPACAIEIMHSFSLIHDDLPAMDNDDLRRGKLTCHKAFDEATAILAGDALAVFAFQIISETAFLAPNQIVAMNKTLALAAGLNGMSGGQDIDIQSAINKPNKNKLEYMYILKTGALLSAAVKFGALAANISNKKELEFLDKIAKNIGLAFQIQDDIFNIESTAKKLGKNINTDVKNNKITYPALIGVKKAKAKIEKLWQNTENYLQQLKANTSILRMFINYIKNRDF